MKKEIKPIELVVKNGEGSNLLIADYSISKLPKSLQEALEDSDSNPSSINIYSFPEEAFLSKKDQLIAIPDVNLVEGDRFIKSEGLELLSITSLQTASFRIFRIITPTKFFILCQDEVEYYCLIGRPANNEPFEKKECSCQSCSCGSKVLEVSKIPSLTIEKEETFDIDFYFAIKEYPNLEPNTPNCQRYHVIITPVDQWHREGCAADQLEDDEHAAFSKLEKALKDKHGIEFEEGTELCFSAYPKPGVDATIMRAALLDVGFQTCSAFDRFIAEHD